jgi:hypothetical protein
LQAHGLVVWRRTGAMAYVRLADDTDRARFTHDGLPPSPLDTGMVWVD